MRKSYVTDNLTSVEIRESIKIGGKMIRIYEGVINRQNFKKLPFRKNIQKMFALGQKHKDK